MKIVFKYKRNKIKRLSHKGRPFWIEPIGNNWWFNLNTKQWQQDYANGEPCSTSYYSMKSDGLNNIYSLKAAKKNS